MSLVLLKSAPSRFLAALGLAALASANAQQPSPPQGSGIRFTEPEAPVTSTNLSETSARNVPFRGLDRTARKPFEFFKSEDSFAGVLAPPPQQRVVLPPSNSRHARELLDRQKNWVFNTPEEMTGAPSPEELLNAREFGPNGEEKETKTGFARYVERLEKARAKAATNQAAGDSLPSWLKPDDGKEDSAFGNDGKKPDSSVFGSFEANFKRPPGSGEFSSVFSTQPETTTERSSSSFFSLRPVDAVDKSAADDAVRAAQDARMRDFSALLGTGSPVSSGGFTPARPQEVTPAPAFLGGSLGSGAFSPQPATRPATLPSLSPAAELPNYATPALSPPPPAAAPRTFTPPLGFELPKRKF